MRTWLKVEVHNIVTQLKFNLRFYNYDTRKYCYTTEAAPARDSGSTIL